jgi:hypothetical protein
VKPWEYVGRRMERNAPIGRRCDETCEHPAVTQGTSVCLCMTCHEVFSCLRNFDAHRKDGWCLDPRTLKKPMTLNGRGVWIVQASGEALERLERMRS